MEGVLAVYTRPRDPDRPLVCLDETSKQLIAETRVPIPMKPGRPARCDYEYERHGVANLFMMFAPLEGWRHVKVTDRHTAVDYAQVLKDLADTHLPMPRSSSSSRTTSTSTARLPSTRRSRPPKPGA
jgi:DDE superfamily endonuclease